MNIRKNRREIQHMIASFAILMATILPMSGNGGSSVVINEIGWMGTKANAGDEWMELFNPTAEPVDLSGWGIYEKGGEILVEELSGSIAPFGFYLIERSDDSTVSNVPASQLPSSWGGSGLSNNGEHLVLKNQSGNIVDEVHASSGWPAGTASPDYISMERIDASRPGNDGANWSSHNGPQELASDANGNSIAGTPGAKNSVSIASPNPSPEEHTGTNTNMNTSILHAPPQAKLIVSNTEANTGEEIVFDASRSSDADTNILSFDWNFGDSARTQGQVVSHRYKEIGSYNVVLKVSDGEFESYDFATIEIYKPQFSSSIFINEFIPNPKGEDAENEWVELKNESEEHVTLSGWKLDDADGGSSAFVIPEKTSIAPRSFLVFNRTQSRIALNNDVDAVRLLWPDNITIQEVTYNESKEGWSAVRSGETWQWTNTPTPGTENSTGTKLPENTKENIPPAPKEHSPVVSALGSLPRSGDTPQEPGNSDADETKTEQESTNEQKNKKVAALVSEPLSHIPYQDLGIAFAIAVGGAFVLFSIKKRLERPPL